MERTKFRTRFSTSMRWIARGMAVLMVWQMAIPSVLAMQFTKRYREAGSALQRRPPVRVVPPKTPAPQPDVRVMNSGELAHLWGRGQYRNPALCGVMPWQRDFHGVNLCTGNLFKSFTDIQVQPGRGAGLAFQRNYNSNDEREDGPFGIGWSFSYDIRMEEPSVNGLQDAKTTVVDPQTGQPVSEPLSADQIVRTDFFGAKHIYHRDADGLYTPPAYMYDELSSNYRKALVDGPLEVQEDIEIGKDGTVKHFKDLDGAGQTRVCDYMDDRHGNRTQFSYESVTDGGATKTLLTRVIVKRADAADLAVGNRYLKISWHNYGSHWRIVQVAGPYGIMASVPSFAAIETPGSSAYQNPPYLVAYDYDTNDPNVSLKAVYQDCNEQYTEPSLANGYVGSWTYPLSQSAQHTGTNNQPLPQRPFPRRGPAPDNDLMPYLNRCTKFEYTTYDDGSGNTEAGLLYRITDPLNNAVVYTYSMEGPDSTAWDADALWHPLAEPTYTGTLWVISIEEPSSQSGQTGSMLWHITPATFYPWCDHVVPYDYGLRRTAMVACIEADIFFFVESDWHLRKILMAGFRPGFADTSVPYCSRITIYGDNYNFYSPTVELENHFDRSGVGWDVGSTYGPYTEPTFNDDVYIAAIGQRHTYNVSGDVTKEEEGGSFNGFDILSPETGVWKTVSESRYLNASQYFQKEWETDARGNTTQFFYYDNTDPGKRGNLSYTMDALNQTHSFQYNAYGQKVSETNERGMVTTYAYGQFGGDPANPDLWGNLTKVVQNSGGLNRTTTMTYDVAGRVLTSKDPMSQTSRFSYDGAGAVLVSRMPTRWPAPAETVKYTYGGDGRTQTVETTRYTSPTNTVLTNEVWYEGESADHSTPGINRVQRVHETLNAGSGSSLNYDHTTSYTYNWGGERASMALPDGKTWRYSYLSLSQRISLDRPETPDQSQIWNFNYDGAYYLSAKDDPNSFGRMLCSIRDDDTTVTDDHTPANTGNKVDYVIDMAGRVADVFFNRTYGTVKGTYRMTSYCQTMYLYDFDNYDVGARTWLKSVETTLHRVDTDEQSVTYGQWITTPIRLAKNEYDYDTAGLKLQNRITGKVADWVFDPSGATAAADVNGTASATLRESYRNSSGGEGYDALNRLTDVRHYQQGPGAAETLDEVQSYGFTGDAGKVGNRTSKSDTVYDPSGTVVMSRTETAAYNAANILTSRTITTNDNGTITTGTYSISADNNGNTTGDYHNNAALTTQAGTEVARTMQWDSQNRLSSCTYNGATSTFVYGPDGLRRTATFGSTTTHYGLDGQSTVQEWKTEPKAGTDHTLTTTATYLTGAQGPLYRMQDVVERDSQGNQVGSPARTSAWYVYDGLGSVIGEVDTSGLSTALKKARVYDVFGGVRHDDYTEANQRTSASKHRFVGSLGHQSEGETGLIYMRARYMDPETGRFLSEDPGRNGNNWFVYCNDDPVNHFDSDGKLSLTANFLIFLVLGVICLVAKNPWVCLGCAVIAAIVCIIDYVQSRDSTVEAGKKPILPWVDEIKKGYDLTKPAESYGGGLLGVIGVIYAEQLVIGILCEEDNETFLKGPEPW